MSAQDTKQKLRGTATMANVGGSSFPKGQGDIDQRVYAIERAIASIGKAVEHLADVVSGLESEIAHLRAR